MTCSNSRVIEKLPYVDVFSVFDDPYIHSPEGKLAEKAQFIVTQNFTIKRFWQNGLLKKKDLGKKKVLATG
ncbi:MAG: hypothetical protein EB127_01910, partial [Alphaproteobacteria bacterium]|nr:hypothetical protein [Alphaproteobacteria bacterium]